VPPCEPDAHWLRPGCSRDPCGSERGGVAGNSIAGAILTDPAKGFDLTSGDVVQNLREFLERGIALERIQERGRRLGQHQSFLHHLLTGGEVGQQRIPTARTLEPGRHLRWTPAQPPPHGRMSERAINLVQRPVEQMHQGVGVSEG